MPQISDVKIFADFDMPDMITLSLLDWSARLTVSGIIFLRSMSANMLQTIWAHA
jgi:hypothetical protein